MADELSVVLDSATMGHDERTGQPVLNLIFTEASRERLRVVSTDNLGQRVELRADGRVIISSVFREPILGGHLQISNPDWTDEAVIDLAQQLSKAPKGEIELRPSSSSR